jgi:hypothetical protein
VKEIQFDDIEGLKAEIKDDFGAFGPAAALSQEMINQFAEITGDHQWIHVDVARCEKESPFGGPIAHGFLTLSMVASMTPGSNYKVSGYGNATNYGSDGFRFLSPVPAGSQVHACTRLVNVQAKPKGTLLTTETAVHVVGSDRPALVYKGLVMFNPPLG